MAEDERFTTSDGVPHNFHFDTLALHAGQRPDPLTGSRAVPIHQTSSFVFEDTAHAAGLFALQDYGYIYSRIGNPTVAVFEERMATLENGIGALATSSGQAAQFLAFFTLLEAGDEIVSAATLYGGTYTQFDVSFRKFGWNVTFVDPDRPEAFREAVTDKTRALYCETIGNPLSNVADLEAIAKIAHECDVPLIVDNTFASPYLCRPLDWGADIVVHSSTKFIGGHGTSIGGVIVDSGRFNWANGKFPSMVSPSKGYHGLNFHETFGELGYITKARTEGMRDMGPCPSPFNAFLFLQGLETLHLRMERHSENAQRVAEFLAADERVSFVNYPGLATSPYYDLGQKYLSQGQSSVFSFGVKGGYEAAVKFIEGLEIHSHLANVGDAKSLIIHPASTTHAQLTQEDMKAGKITPELLRISVGIEHIDDILWDLDCGLTTATK
ncbi:MAG: O-acetylhomoserine aminocarboxypropyltransferase/cysteine synthase [Nitrospinaceae bacterium]|jgi:O-acetylhomoserine (thiol)-lyase|nr:O-acetylhomoserine aminocarboxypropyltransferase/cysteine synthase [Nitrospinaceae bacterium]MBT3435275.1 O-acetylhomoserine aminocarboxypropyltransferase/cysteine synthase [Nitrospinaceae bacterium]MBT3820813.1 O-acetylhomoserine aminocarboxypropyltransferase/cysteine synthase [Nitrospinaceae bacterium]MBT4095792.1 O-acetylhomoserine aminocarboxypropyltransferase/cysteine synthase [Nitrospinaceae bacterium]MBT5369277.1 O-acetylhomoserine aminocarboxypropyltransferase/cysteine synthase [Nitr